MTTSATTDEVPQERPETQDLPKKTVRWFRRFAMRVLLVFADRQKVSHPVSGTLCQFQPNE